MIIRKARPTDAAGITHVHVTTWRTTYRGIVPDGYLDNIPVEQWQERWLRDLREPGDRFIYVAEDEANGTIAGFVMGGPGHPDEPIYKGELHTLYILKEYQQRGLGRLLVQALATSLLEAGISSMLLMVMDANPGRHFYEALGGTRVRSNTFEVNGVAIAESAYGWTNIRSLLQDTHT